MAGPLVRCITEGRRPEALTVIADLRVAEALPALETLAEQDRRIAAINVFTGGDLGDGAWADEALRERVIETIAALR